MRAWIPKKKESRCNILWFISQYEHKGLFCKEAMKCAPKFSSSNMKEVDHFLNFVSRLPKYQQKKTIQCVLRHAVNQKAFDDYLNMFVLKHESGRSRLAEIFDKFHHLAKDFANRYRLSSSRIPKILEGFAKIGEDFTLKYKELLCPLFDNLSDTDFIHEIFYEISEVPFSRLNNFLTLVNTQKKHYNQKISSSDLNYIVNDVKKYFLQYDQLILLMAFSHLGTIGPSQTKQNLLEKAKSLPIKELSKFFKA